MQHKTNERLEALLDNNSYDDAELMELKVPLHLPYQNNWTAFERYDGEIEINGTIYKYVKRKLANDTLYVMCIPNSNKMKLEIAKNNFFKNSNDIAQNDRSKKTSNSKLVFKNAPTLYNESAFGINLFSPGAFVPHSWLPQAFQTLLSASPISPEQPPDFRCA
jgi:hypothetical protein